MERYDLEVLEALAVLDRPGTTRPKLRAYLNTGAWFWRRWTTIGLQNKLTDLVERGLIYAEKRGRGPARGHESLTLYCVSHRGRCWLDEQHVRKD